MTPVRGGSTLGRTVLSRMRRDRRADVTRDERAPRRDHRSARWPAGLDPYAGLLGVAGLLLLATRQEWTVPYTGLGLPPAQLIALVLVGLWVLTRAVGQRSPAGLGLLSALIAVRLAFLLISYGLAAGRLLTADQRAGSDRALGAEVVAGASVVVLATVLRSRRDIEFVLRLLVAGGTISAAYGLVQYATGVDLASSLHLPGLRDTGGSAASAAALVREGLVRARGAASVPLELGAIAAVLVPLALGLFFAARSRGEVAWPWAVATLVLVGGGAVSLSRSVFLASGVALVVMMLRWPVRRAVVVVGAGAVLVGAALATGTRIVDAIATVFSQGSDDYSLGSRSDGRSYVWANFAHHFWFGQGPGTYDQTVQPILDNQYLSQLMETGTFGLLFFTAVLLCAFGYAVRASGRLVAPDAAELATSLAGALAALLVVSAVLDTAGFVQIFSLIWFVVGLTAAMWRVTVQAQPPSGSTRRGRGSLTAQRAPRASTSG